MKRRRFIEESEGEEYLHKSTWQVVQRQFDRPDNPKQGSLYDDLVAMVFAFHTLEGYLNFIGEKILPDGWEEFERISLEAKLTLILRECGLSNGFEKGRRPYQTVATLTKLRHSIAHPKTLKTKSREIYTEGKEPPIFPKSYLATMVSHEKALRARDDVKFIVERIHGAAAAKFPALHLGNDGLEGISRQYSTSRAAHPDFPETNDG